MIIAFMPTQAFAATPPVKPDITGLSVEEANRLIDEYNAAVERYNKEVEEEYRIALLEAARLQAEEDAKVAANTTAINEAEAANQAAQAQADEANQAERERVNAANEKLIADTDTANAEIIQQANDEYAQTVQEVNEHNAAETVKVEESKELHDEAVAHNDKEDEKVAAAEADIVAIETKISNDAPNENYIANFTDDPEELPTNWDNVTPEEDLKTIEVIKSSNPVGELIKVINLHIYLFLDEIPWTIFKGGSQYSDEHFEFTDEVKDGMIFAEWEVAEVDVDDTVITKSEAESWKDNRVYHNGKDGYGFKNMDLYTYFARAIEGYTQGFWNEGSSEVVSNANTMDMGWGYDYETGEGKGGSTYTVEYTPQETSVPILVNGQQEYETIETRTTDRAEPKNIFSVFTYIFQRYWEEPEEYEPEYVDVPDIYEPQYQEVPKFEAPTLITPVLEEPNLVEPKLVDVPEKYEPAKIETPVAPTLLDRLARLIPAIPRPTPTPDPIPPVIIITPTPTPAPTVTPAPEVPDRSIDVIEDNDTPLAPPAVSVWALANLILLVLTILVLLKLNKKKYTIFTPIIVVASLILFILTENVYNPMVIFDKWTVWMLLFYVLAILSRALAKTEEEENDKEKSE